MRFFSKFILILVVLFSAFILEAHAAGQSIGLRNPNACGLYLSSLMEDSEGLFKAPLSLDKIEEYLRSPEAREDLKPVLVFKDKKTRKKIKDPVELERALKEDRAIPVLNKKTINIVGVPLTGREKRQYQRLVKAIVDEQLADLELRIRVLGRPEQAGLYAETEDGWMRVADPIMKDHEGASTNSERYGIENYFRDLSPEEAEKISSYRLKGLKFRERFPVLAQTMSWLNPFSRSRAENTLERTQELIQEVHSEDANLSVGWEKPATYAFHRFVYFFPLPQDYQKFTADEIAAGKAKLAINTPIGFFSLWMAKPLPVALAVTAANFVQSAGTAAYSVVLANWFSRSHKSDHVERLGKNAVLSSFFTILPYWAGRGSWEKFQAVASAQGWWDFIKTKWSTVAFNIFWRFFVSNGVYKWEQIEKEKADNLNPEDFESEEDFIQAKKEIRDYARATRSRIETVASTVGTVGYLLAAVLPMSFVPESWGWHYFQYGIGHLIMTGLGGVGALVYFRPELIDQVGLPKKMEALHQGISDAASWVRARQVVQSAERNMTSFYTRRAQVEAQEGREFLGRQDVREYFSLDDSLVEMIDENPELLNLIQEDARVHRLLRKHPEYEEFIPH